MVFETNQERIHAVVSGMVQGIGYRYLCQKVAQRMRLSGWVRNLANGDVELEVEGSATDIKTFLSEIRTGNQWAHVNDIKITKLTVRRDKSGFRISF